MLLDEGLAEASEWYNENENSASHLGLLSHTHYEVTLGEGISLRLLMFIPLVDL